MVSLACRRLLSPKPLPLFLVLNSANFSMEEEEAALILEFEFSEKNFATSVLAMVSPACGQLLNPKPLPL